MTDDITSTGPPRDGQTFRLRAIAQRDSEGRRGKLYAIVRGKKKVGRMVRTPSGAWAGYALKDSSARAWAQKPKHLLTKLEPHL